VATSLHIGWIVALLGISVVTILVIFISFPAVFTHAFLTVPIFDVEPQELGMPLLLTIVLSFLLGVMLNITGMNAKSARLAWVIIYIILSILGGTIFFLTAVYS
jgi:hypothetical protein